MFTKVPLDPGGHVVTRGSHAEYIVSGTTYVGPYNLSSACAQCGQCVTPVVAGGVARIAGPCPDGEGITTSITLAVPSGKMIVTDDLRPVYNGFNESFASYNSARGQAQVIEAMAALGCAFGPVGNSCPGFYRVTPDEYVIACSPAGEGDDDDDDDDEESHEVPPVTGAQLVAGIITDLWAYSIADFEHWKACAGERHRPRGHVTIVDVSPGTYRFTHHTGELGFDHDAPGAIIFAHVTKVSVAEPVAPDHSQAQDEGRA